MPDVESELYRDDQRVLTCAVCACRYPATRRRLAGELEALPVCTDRCRTHFLANAGARETADAANA